MSDQGAHTGDHEHSFRIMNTSAVFVIVHSPVSDSETVLIPIPDSWTWPKAYPPNTYEAPGRQER